MRTTGASTAMATTTHPIRFHCIVLSHPHLKGHRPGRREVDYDASIWRIVPYSSTREGTLHLVRAVTAPVEAST